MQLITRFISVVMMILGAVMVTIALANGGGPLAFGVLVGALFVAAGAGRMWLEKSR